MCKLLHKVYLAAYTYISFNFVVKVQTTLWYQRHETFLALTKTFSRSEQAEQKTTAKSPIFQSLLDKDFLDFYVFFKSNMLLKWCDAHNKW